MGKVDVGVNEGKHISMVGLGQMQTYLGIFIPVRNDNERVC